ESWLRRTAAAAYLDGKIARHFVWGHMTNLSPFPLIPVSRAKRSFRGAPMNDTPRQNTAETDDDHLLDELVDRIIAKVQAGEPVELSHFAGAGPQRLVRLRQLLPAIQAATHMTGFGADPPQGSRALGHIEL